MTLTPHQQGIVNKIVALRKMTTEMGFKTTRSQNDLLDRLNSGRPSRRRRCLVQTKPDQPEHRLEINLDWR